MADKYADLLPLYHHFCLEFISLIWCAKLSNDLVLPMCYIILKCSAWLFDFTYSKSANRVLKRFLGSLLHLYDCYFFTWECWILLHVAIVTIVSSSVWKMVYMQMWEVNWTGAVYVYGFTLLGAYSKQAFAKILHLKTF